MNTQYITFALAPDCGLYQHFPVGFTKENDTDHSYTDPHSSAHGLLHARFASASQTIRSGPERQRQHDGVRQHHHAPTQHKLVTETASTWMT